MSRRFTRHSCKQKITHSRDFETPHPILCKIVIEGDAVPEWTMLFPAGANIKCRDGREFGNKTPDKVVSAFVENAMEIPIDIEHATQVKGAEGEPAPAVGWITQLEAREGAVWGRCEWNEYGAYLVKSRSYRYGSPSFMYDEEEKTVVKIESFALTNHPAFKMPAIARGQQGAQKKMDKELLAMLGLGDDATPEQVTAAVKAMKDATAKTIEESKASVEKARADALDLGKSVPRADYDALKSQVASMQKNIADKEKSDRDVAIASAVDEALKARKIYPASKEFYVHSCSQSGGLEAFLKFIADAPVIAPDQGPMLPPTPTAKTASAEALAIAARAGITKEQFEAAL